jgi:hypothetical protein
MESNNTSTLTPGSNWPLSFRAGHLLAWLPVGCKHRLRPLFDELASPGQPRPVQQPQQFLWFTRDRLEIGGPITRWADIFASGAGQWASQTEPPASDQRNRLLFGNASGRVRAGASDRFDALYSGSRINLTDGGIPAGLAALTGSRMAPSLVLPGGFPGEPETDHLDPLQVGWTHQMSAASALGIVQVRYGYAIAHLLRNTLTLWVLERVGTRKP